MRPIEFQMLGITPPAWEPIDSLAVGRLLTWRLAENHQAELVRAALAAKFGEAVARQLTGVYPVVSVRSIMQTAQPAAATSGRSPRRREAAGRADRRPPASSG